MGQTNNMIYNLVGKAGFNKEAPMLDAFLHQIPTSIFDLSPYFLQLEPFIFFLLSCFILLIILFTLSFSFSYVLSHLYLSG